MKLSREQQLSEYVSDIRADSEAFTDDMDVADAFDEEQRRQNLERRSQFLGSEQPQIQWVDTSGGDLDADGVDADVVGEAAVGGQNPTPAQDVVEMLGRAVGLVYNDEEPLDTTHKLERRDRHRWELDPASSEDYRERH